MDGTLIDSEPFWQAAEYELVESGGGVWTHDDALALVGSDLMAAAHVLVAAGAPMSPEEVVQFLVARVSGQISSAVPWREGAQDTLAWIKAAGMKCALVTSSHAPIAQAFVDATPEGTFEVVVSGDKVERGKPAPDPYELAAQLLGVDIRECIALEDSNTGITSAMASGARTIGIEAISPVAPRPGLSRITHLRHLTPATFDVVMRGGVVDFA